MREQDGRGLRPERQPATGSTRNILIQGNAETQMQITGLNAVLPGMAKELTTHHAGISGRVHLQRNRTRVYQHR